MASTVSIPGAISICFLVVSLMEIHFMAVVGHQDYFNLASPGESKNYLELYNLQNNYIYKE